MLTSNDVYELINYTSFVESLFMAVSVAGLLWLRYKQPNRERPIKVSQYILRESFHRLVLQVLANTATAHAKAHPNRKLHSPNEPAYSAPLMLAPNTYKLVIVNAILFPLQVNLGFPISFFVICVFLVVLPVYVTPMLVAVDLLILLVGVAVYLLFIRWRRKPKAVEKMLR